MANSEWSREEIARLRGETAGCQSDRIYLNNAGASFSPKVVVDRIIRHLKREAEMGGYEAANEASDEQDAVYTSIAKMVGGKPDEIALMESATRAWQMAFYSLPLGQGDRILTAENEYASNFIALLQTAKRRGAEIVVIPSASTGEIDLEMLEGELKKGSAKCIALTHIATNSGVVQPAAEVGRLARQYGVPYLLDACQSVGQIKIDVQELGCDMLSATGRKYLRGPRGTGFLWIRRELCRELEPAMLDMDGATWVARGDYQIREDARRFECWESSIAGRLGLGVAVNYAMEIGLERIECRIQQLAEQLRRALAVTDGITVQDRGTIRSGIVTFTHARLIPQQIVQKLAEQGIVVRVSPREATRIDMENRGLMEVVRASVHYYNTEGELERVCQALAGLR